MKLARTMIVGSLAVIAVYIGVSHATGGGTLLAAAWDGASKYAKTLQGR